MTFPLLKRSPVPFLEIQAVKNFHENCQVFEIPEGFFFKTSISKGYGKGLKSAFSESVHFIIDNLIYIL